MDVTTLESEIERHRKLADLLLQFAALSGDAQIFNATTMASVYNKTANRLAELKRKMADSVK